MERQHPLFDRITLDQTSPSGVMRRIYLDSALIIWLAEQTTHAEMYQMPPSCRFPPLREGNHAGVRFPLRAGGTLRRGLSTAAFVDSRSLNSA
jgi:hypothetical protein